MTMGPAGASDDSLDRRLRRVETAVRALAARVDLLLRRQAERGARGARDPRIPALPDPPEAREFLASYRPPRAAEPPPAFARGRLFLAEPEEGALSRARD